MQVTLSRGMLDKLFGPGASDAITAEAVEAEREQGAAKLREATDAAEKSYRLNTCLHPVCEKRIRCSEPKPEPPAPKPMTVEKVLANIRGGPMTWRHGPDSERDLIRLVKEQARTDAELCESLYKGPGCHPDWLAGCQECERLIQVDAGLE